MSLPDPESIPPLNRPPIIKVLVPFLERWSLFTLSGPAETDTLARIKAQKPPNPRPLILFFRTILHVLGNISVNFVPSTLRNAPFLFVSAATLALCFAAGNPQMPLLFVVLPGVFGLAVSEAHIFRNPGKNGALYQGVHALFMMTGVTIAQIIQWLTVPALALSAGAFKFGLASSILAITSFGIIATCLRHRGEDRLIVSAQAMAVICLLWVWAGAVLLKRNPLPGFFSYQHFMMDFGIGVALVLALRERVGRIGGIWDTFITIREGFDVEDLTIRLNGLLMAAKGEPVSKKARLLEGLGLAGIAYWPLSAIYWIASGRVPLAQVDWLRWLPECIGLTALLVLWHVIRNMVTQLQAAIDKKEEAGTA